MKYIVTRYFTDAQDNNHAYSEGDIFPRAGLTVSDARIKDLLSGNNFQRIALIKRDLTDEKPKNGEVKWTAEEIEKMPYMKLKSVAKQNDVEVKDREASDVRADLIEKLGL